MRSQRSWRRALARRPKHHSGLDTGAGGVTNGSHFFVVVASVVFFEDFFLHTVSLDRGTNHVVGPPSVRRVRAST